MESPRANLLLDIGWIMERHRLAFLIIAVAVSLPQIAAGYLIYQTINAVAAPEMQLLLYLWAWVPVTIVNVAAIAPAEIHWHRILILGERHRFAGYFLFDSKTLRYMAVGFLLMSFLTLPDLAGIYAWNRWFVDPIDGTIPATAYYRIFALKEIVTIALSLLFATCLGPIFSAIAVGRKRSSFAEIFRMTREHRRQIALAYFLGYEIWQIGGSLFEMSFIDRLTGFSAWDFAYAVFVNWTIFRYLAITADIYMELERRLALDELAPTFD